VTDPAPLAEAAATVADLARHFLDLGAPLEHLDLGGGLGIAYRPDERVMTPETYAAAILPAVRRTGLSLVLEPGRWIVGPAGLLLTRVVDLKAQPPGDRQFVVVDAGMTDLIRPALYDAYHDIETVTPRSAPRHMSDVVGPVCETSDTLGASRCLPDVEVGDLLAVRDTGAYGSVMASNYNRRPFAAEALVAEGTWQIVRRRQTVDDMLQWDV
jgi:diaminopimelate decarboxylase